MKTHTVSPDVAERISLPARAGAPAPGPRSGSCITATPGGTSLAGGAATCDEAAALPTGQTETRRQKNNAGALRRMEEILSHGYAGARKRNRRIDRRVCW